MNFNVFLFMLTEKVFFLLLWKRDLSTAQIGVPTCHTNNKGFFYQKYFVCGKQTGVWCLRFEIQLYFGVGIIITMLLYIENVVKLNRIV